VTFGKYVTRVAESWQRSSRPSSIRWAVLHHAATTNIDVVVDEMVSGSKEVSATNVIKDKQIVGVVPEEFRPWTTASPYWDGGGVTVECANESTNGWTISDASYQSLGLVVADWSARYNFPLNRSGAPSTWTLFGHGEIYKFFGDSYATACPGSMNLDRVLDIANGYKYQWAGVIKNVIETGEKDTMFRIKREKTGDTYGIGLGFIKHHVNGRDNRLTHYIVDGVNNEEGAKGLNEQDFFSVLWQFGLDELAADLSKLPSKGGYFVASWLRGTPVS
jgi:hypothetical protein